MTRFCSSFFFLLLLLAPMGLCAQSPTAPAMPEAPTAPSTQADSVGAARQFSQQAGRADGDSLSYAAPPRSHWGYAPLGYGLHKGLNVSFGLSAHAAWGKYAPKGVGFGQQLALQYVQPLNERWSIALGAYVNNLNWGSYADRALGLSALVQYRANSWLNLYAFAEKNLAAKHSLPLWGYGSYGSAALPYAGWGFSPYALAYPAMAYGIAPWVQPDLRVGAAASFQLGEHAAIGISVSYNQYDTSHAPIIVARAPAYNAHNW